MRPLKDPLQSLQLAAVEGGAVPPLLLLPLGCPTARAQALTCGESTKELHESQTRARPHRPHMRNRPGSSPPGGLHCPAPCQPCSLWAPGTLRGAAHVQPCDLHETQTPFQDLLELSVKRNICKDLWWFRIWLKPPRPDFEYQSQRILGQHLTQTAGTASHSLPSTRTFPWGVLGLALAKGLGQAFTDSDGNSAPKHLRDEGLSSHLQHPLKPWLWHVPRVTQGGS